MTEDVKPSGMATPKSDPKLAELASKINSEFAGIIKADRDVMAANHNNIERGIILGQQLNEAKDRVAHGEWLPWLKLNCPDILSVPLNATCICRTRRRRCARR